MSPLNSSFGNMNGSSFGNGGNSKWPSRKIPSQSFAAKRGFGKAGAGMGVGSGKTVGKFGSGSKSKDARKKAIEDLAWDMERDQTRKIHKENSGKQKEYWKNIKLSEESENIVKLLEESSENLFITGRAGTGKSTLLGYFREFTKKNVVVVAPTGVAALNVKGQTIHGFFKFKIGVTEHDVKKITAEVDEKMYKKMDMLIIDEISMVRADLFDCIDKFLRLNGRDKEKPFGGVQIVVIGDLFQLPPVVTDGERYIFETKYESPYFFDSKAYRKGGFQVVELSHVYRQHDPEFINILDKIRTGEAEMEHVQYINRMCHRKFGTTFTSNFSAAFDVNKKFDIKNEKSRNEDGEEIISLDEDVNGGIEEIEEDIEIESEVPAQSLKKIDVQNNSKKLTVCLVTTNALADTINLKKLQALHGAVKTYKGALVGRFDQKNAPAPTELNLKIGAQVMILKNDPMGKWVNGDIGIVEKFLDNAVRIRLEDGRLEEIAGESWEMVKYEYDEITDHLESEVVGKYTQIPIRLAWAVTIHKSQGKTFDSAVIDFGRGTFAHGQAYVALSRVRSLQGITLVNPLRPEDLRTDWRVVEFLNGSR